MLTKEDCFAFRLKGKIRRCNAMDKVPCDECTFYKSREEFIQDLKKYPPDLSKLRGESLIPKEWEIYKKKPAMTQEQINKFWDRIKNETEVVNNEC